jgi:hypothetical protein
MVERLRKKGDGPLACTLPETMAVGADQFQTRLDEARERLRREIPPPAEE